MQRGVRRAEIRQRISQKTDEPGVADLPRAVAIELRAAHRFARDRRRAHESCGHAIALRATLPPRGGATRASGGERIEQPRISGERGDQPPRDPDRLVFALGPRGLRAELAAADPLRPALPDHACLPALGEQFATVAVLAEMVVDTADHDAA